MEKLFEDLKIGRKWSFINLGHLLETTKLKHGNQIEVNQTHISTTIRKKNQN